MHDVASASAHVSSVAGASVQPAFHSAATRSFGDSISTVGHDEGEEQRRKSARFTSPSPLHDHPPSFSLQESISEESTTQQLNHNHKRIGLSLTDTHDSDRPSKRVFTDDERSERTSTSETTEDRNLADRKQTNAMLKDLHQQRIERRRKQEWLDALQEVETESSSSASHATTLYSPSSHSTAATNGNNAFFASPPRVRYNTRSSRHFDPLPEASAVMHRSTEAALPGFVFRGAPASKPVTPVVAAAASAASSSSLPAYPAADAPMLSASPPQSASKPHRTVSSYRLPMSPLARFHASPRTAAADETQLLPRPLTSPVHLPWWDQQAQQQLAAKNPHPPLKASSRTEAAAASTSATPSALSSPWPFSDDSWASNPSSSSSSSSVAHRTAAFTADNVPFETMPWKAGGQGEEEEEKRDSRSTAAQQVAPVRSSSDAMLD
jgi:hypothetical protein